MKLLKALLILALCVPVAGTLCGTPARADFEPPSPWEPLYGVDVVQFKKQSTGEIFTAVLIGTSGRMFRQANRSGGDFDTTDLDFFAQRMLRAAHRWAYSELAKAYSEVDESVFKTILSEDSAADNRSSMVIMMRGLDATSEGLIGTFRVSLQEPGYFLNSREQVYVEEFPAERHFGFRYPRPKLSEGPVSYPLLTPDGLQPFVSYQGSTAELKNLVRKDGVDEDLVRMMAVLAELWGFSASPTLSGQMNFGLTAPYYFPGRRAQRPSEYFLTTHKRMIPYYKRIGFTQTLDLGKEDNVVMKISRAAYLAKMMQWWRLEAGQIVRGIHDNYQVIWDASESWRKVSFGDPPQQSLCEWVLSSWRKK